MKTLLIALTLCISSNSFSQDLHAEENKYLGYIYQQDKYQLVDEKGDVLLLWTAKQIPQFITKSLKGQGNEHLKERQKKIDNLLEKYPEYQPKEETLNLIVEDYLDYNPNHEPIALEGHKAPFKVKNLSLMMKQVITEEYQSGITPQEGQVHEWSPEIKKQLRKTFPMFSRMSKLLVALSRGGTSSYMVTGTEDALVKYILSRPMDSISLEEMFRASYRINNGDVYLSLLTIENCLSRFWLTPHRSKRAITTRLQDITNYNYKGDKFGAWYHLFGMMLYGYAKGGTTAKIIGNIETLGSHFLSKFKDEAQENFINSRGGPVGHRVKKFITSKAYESFETDSQYLDEAFYLNLNEDFSKRIERAKRRKLKSEI